MDVIFNVFMFSPGVITKSWLLNFPGNNDIWFHCLYCPSFFLS